MQLVTHVQYLCYIGTERKPDHAQPKMSTHSQASVTSCIIPNKINDGHINRIILKGYCRVHLKLAVCKVIQEFP